MSEDQGEPIAHVLGSALTTEFAPRSTRPNTAATCCSPPAGRWRTCLTGSWTAPGPGWTSARCGAIFGLKARPHRTRPSGPPAQELVIENPQYGLAWFRISFGVLQAKAHTQGHHTLPFEATTST